MKRNDGGSRSSHGGEESENFLEDALRQDEERKQSHIIPENHEEEEHEAVHEEGESWLISFADLLSNLLLFFIVMYSISSVDEGKFNLVAKALDKNFQAQKPKDNIEILVENQAKTAADNAEIVRQVQTLMQKINPSILESDKAAGKVIKDAQAHLGEMFYLTPQASPFNPFLEVIMSGDRYFKPMNPEPTELGAQALQKLASEIGTAQDSLKINIESIVDTTEYKASEAKLPGSGWELSVKRASRVMGVLQRSGIKASQMKVSSVSEIPETLNNQTENRATLNERKVRIRIERIASEAKNDSTDTNTKK